MRHAYTYTHANGPTRQSHGVAHLKPIYCSRCVAHAARRGAATTANGSCDYLILRQRIASYGYVYVCVCVCVVMSATTTPQNTIVRAVIPTIANCAPTVRTHTINDNATTPKTTTTTTTTTTKTTTRPYASEHVSAARWLSLTSLSLLPSCMRPAQDRSALADETWARPARSASQPPNRNCITF